MGISRFGGFIGFKNWLEQMLNVRESLSVTPPFLDAQLVLDGSFSGTAGITQPIAFSVDAGQQGPGTFGFIIIIFFFLVP